MPPPYVLLINIPTLYLVSHSRNTWRIIYLLHLPINYYTRVEEEANNGEKARGVYCPQDY